MTNVVVITVVIWFVICACIIFGIMQILWIRNKLDLYSKAKLSSELLLRQRMNPDDMLPRTNLKTYSVVVDVLMTNTLNNTSSKEFQSYVPKVSPKTFNIPYICADRIESTNVSFSTGYRIVLDNRFGSCLDLIGDIDQRNILYLMLNGILFIASVDQRSVLDLQQMNPAFNNLSVVNLFVIDAPQNVSLGSTSNCIGTTTLFFGQNSQGSTPSDYFKFPPGTTAVKYHVLGFSSRSI
jgi:hypothetical protein